MKRHQNKAHPEHMTYECSRCHTVFRTQNELITHKEEVCKGANLECPNCKKCFVYRHKYEPHLEICTKILFANGKWCCQQCSMSFSTLSQYSTHEKRVHLKQYKFLCNLCGKGFMRRDKHDQHLARHVAQKPHQCTLCQRKFYLEHALKRHVPTCRGPGLSCPHCDRVFYSQDYYDKHVKYQHENPHAFQCDVCGSSLTGARNLVNHRRDVHGIMAGKPRPKRLPPDAFKCLHCDRTLTSRRNLRNHLQNVHNVRPDSASGADS